MPSVNCNTCNKEFQIPNCRIGKRKHCSKSCYLPNISKSLINRVARECLVCGTQFMATPSRIKDGKAKYCSKNCFNTTQSIRLNIRWSNPQYRQRMSEVHKGQKMSESTKEKQRQRMTGNKYCLGKIPWNKGQGIATDYQRYKFSNAHKEWRTQIFIRDNYTCKECGTRSGNGKRVELNADHIKPYALYPDLRLALSNGRTLCIDCHRQTETYGGNIIRLRKQQHSSNML